MASRCAVLQGDLPPTISRCAGLRGDRIPSRSRNAPGIDGDHGAARAIDQRNGHRGVGATWLRVHQRLGVGLVKEMSLLAIISKAQGGVLLLDALAEAELPVKSICYEDGDDVPVHHRVPFGLIVVKIGRSPQQAKVHHVFAHHHARLRPSTRAMFTQV